MGVVANSVRVGVQDHARPAAVVMGWRDESGKRWMCKLRLVVGDDWSNLKLLAKRKLELLIAGGTADHAASVAARYALALWPSPWMRRR